MPKEHRLTIRRVGPSYVVKCPRCGMTWSRPTWTAAIDRANTHLQHNHADVPRSGPLSIGTWRR